jgi:hypothetical protein
MNNNKNIETNLLKHSTHTIKVNKDNIFCQTCNCIIHNILDCSILKVNEYYNFSQLSKEAKQKAIERQVNFNIEIFDYDMSKEYIIEFLSDNEKKYLENFDIEYDISYSQNDFFVCSFEIELCNLKYIIPSLNEIDLIQLNDLYVNASFDEYRNRQKIEIDYWECDDITELEKKQQLKI